MIRQCRRPGFPRQRPDRRQVRAQSLLVWGGTSSASATRRSAASTISTAQLKTDRVSQIYLEGLHDRNYISTRFYNTHSLLFTDEPFSEATVYPIVDYDYIVNKPILGGELSFNSNAMAFSSQDGADTQRAIVEANWRRQMIDGIGQVYTPVRPAARRRLRRRRRRQERA